MVSSSVIRVTVRAFLFAVIAIISLHSQSFGQWRIPTPRDTVYVPAKPGGYISSKITLSAGVDMFLYAGSTFSLFAQQNADGIDAAYTYKAPGWNIFSPLLNPPTYNSIKFDWGLFVAITVGLKEGYFAPLESNYQPSHNYTSRVTSQGNKLQFKIKAPSSAYNNVGSGGINIRMARWTAGIAIKNIDVDFGNVNVGQAVNYLDSIASYGLDPLQVDSMILVGIAPVGTNDFTFQSERGDRFPLLTENVNQIRFTVTPSIKGNINGELHIYCRNADQNSRYKVIRLHAFGIAPTLTVGPQFVDFGKVRIGKGAITSTNISNEGGNTTLTITAATNYVPTPPAGAFSRVFPATLPFDVTAGSSGQIKTFFNPTARIHYQGKLYVRGTNVQTDSVTFQGDGAEPVPVLSDSVLRFKTVYRGDQDKQTLTLTNKGNWTCSVILAQITGQFKSVFSFSPNDSVFFVEPDSSRTFTITFQPGTGIDHLQMKAYFRLVYDDFTQDTVTLLGEEIQPQVTSRDTIHDFGKVKLNISKSDTITLLRNTSSNATLGLNEQQILPSTYFKLDKPISPIPAQTSVPVQATFTPTIPGPFKAYFYMTVGNKRDSVELRGIGAVAKAIFNPTPVNYGIVKSNVSDTITTTLTDSGDYPLRVVWFEIKGADAKDFAIVYKPSGRTPIPTFTISEDSTVQIDVRFSTNAKTGLAHRATLCVHYDDSSSDCIPLEAIEEAQYLQFGQPAIDFGNVRVKTHLQKSASFRNGSGKTLSLDTVTVTPEPGEFTILNKLKPIAPFSTDSSLKIDFYPGARGAFTGYLHGSGGDFKTDSIQLRGKGVAPVAEFSETVIDFGTVVLNIAATPKQFTITNTGDWLLHVINIQMIGDKKNEFRYAKQKGGSPLEDSVDQQQNSSYDVFFTPTSQIVYHSARMLFTFDDSSTASVLLEGYDESPFLVLDLDSLNFGKVRIGTKPSDTVRLVSTSPDTLVAGSIRLVGSNDYSAAPLGTDFKVLPKVLQDIDVQFVPSAIGPATAKLLIDGKQASNDTTYITGIGAMPVARFALDTTVIDTLDFGAMFNGYTSTKTTILKNIGNWDLSTLSYTISGADAADFTAPTLPQQMLIAENNSNALAITYKASTLYQATPRIAEIVFILDDSTTFKLYLKAQDIAPIKVDLRFDNSNIRVGDVVYPNLRLKTAIPDSLNVNHIAGVITWDPMVASLIEVAQGQMLSQTASWTLTRQTGDIPGQYTYDLESTTGHLSTPGSILRLQFKAAPTAKTGDQTILKHSTLSFPLRSELAIQEQQGVIVIDSACGNIHLTSGAPKANFIQMNSPNPFGSGSGNEVTTIPFSVGSDETSVTIRILDITGREVSRPINGQLYKQGSYELRLSANDIPNSGTYLYEFIAGNDKPTVRKMLVRK